MNKKISTCNLAMFISLLVLVFGVWYNTIYPLFYLNLQFVGIIVTIPYFSFGLFYGFVKYPLFLKKYTSEPVYGNKIAQRNLDWFGKLLTILFYPERSKFESFFSETQISLYRYYSNCYFKWENDNAKAIHKFLDFIVMTVLSIIYGIGCYICHKYLIGTIIVIAILFPVILVLKEISKYVLSVKVDEKNKKDVRIKVNYSNFHLGNKKVLGKALILNNSILISNEIYKNDEIIYEYVVSHEEGHLKDFLAKFIFSLRIFLSSFMCILPLILYFTLNTLVLAILPTFLYIYLVVLFRCKINQKIELNADIYALNDIGQEKLIFALELLAEKESGIYLKNKGLSFDKRIKEINEYVKKAK